MLDKSFLFLKAFISEVIIEYKLIKIYNNEVQSSDIEDRLNQFI